MVTTVFEDISDLRLDLNNFRTVPQVSEADAVHAMISISPDRFWALMESLVDDGYLPTENILVLDVSSGNNTRCLVVKEGNRRIAVLKMLHGLLNPSIDFPENINMKVKSLSSRWKAENLKVPCTIYEAGDASLVDRIVTLAHGKGEKAGRDQWQSVARARHNRDLTNASEPGLDLLEKYLKVGNNLTSQQAERWAGDYHLSALDEAVKKLSILCGTANARDLADKYPNIKFRDPLENVIRDIGLKILTFPKMRQSNHNFTDYGFPSSTVVPGITSTMGSSTGSSGSVGLAGPVTGGIALGGTSALSKGTNEFSTGVIVESGREKKVAAVALQDPKAVARILKKFTPRGNNREKVVTLRDEAKKLKLADNPIAFCFLLRSMFEISAKAYCEDHKPNGPKATKTDGSDRNLIETLKDITSHLTRNHADRAMQKVLHGAITDLAKPEGLLSVTSMNQLVHNPKFSVQVSDICCLFINIFPLLETMNQ